MRVFLLTQEDAFYIPKLLRRFLGQLPAEIEVAGAAILPGEISRKNTLRYLRFMGARDFFRTGLLYAIYRALDVLERVLPLDGSYSVRGVLSRFSVEVMYPSSVNSEAFRDHIRKSGIDLIVSVACPQIVREELLAVPPEGCINIHGALLPKYGGLMPSFWVLANGEEKTGVTVHFMNDRVDEGPIILQKEVPIRGDDTLHSLVLRSKTEFGADALGEAVLQIARDEVVLHETDGDRATYYSFPTPEAVAEFRRRGRRFR